MSIFIDPSNASTPNQSIAFTFTTKLSLDQIYTLLVWFKALDSVCDKTQTLYSLSNGVSGRYHRTEHNGFSSIRERVITVGTNTNQYISPDSSLDYPFGNNWLLYSTYFDTHNTSGNIELRLRNIRKWTSALGDSGTLVDSATVTQTTIGTVASSQYIDRLSIGDAYSDAWLDQPVSQTKYAHLVLLEGQITDDEHVALRTKNVARAIQDGDITESSVLLWIPFETDFTATTNQLGTLTPVARNVTTGANINADNPSLLEFVEATTTPTIATTATTTPTTTRTFLGRQYISNVTTVNGSVVVNPGSADVIIDNRSVTNLDKSEIDKEVTVNKRVPRGVKIVKNSSVEVVNTSRGATVDNSANDYRKYSNVTITRTARGATIINP